MAAFHTILKICKDFCKKNLTNIKLVSNSFKIESYFYINTQFLIIWNLSKYINLLVLAAVLTTLAKLVIFKTRIEKHTIKHNNSQIFKHLHPTATCFQYNSLTFKITDKAHSKFDFKIKEALHINLREPNLKAQQNDLAFTLSPLWSFLFFFCFSLLSIIFIIRP